MVSKLFRAYGLYNRICQSKTRLFNSVSKLFRAYGLYNDKYEVSAVTGFSFQSSFELTGYITAIKDYDLVNASLWFQSSFELTGYITN